MHPRDKYPRTSCDCNDCKSPCRSLTGMLAPGDVTRIAAHLGKPVDEVLPMFRASPGAKVGVYQAGKIITYRIPTIVPAQDAAGHCVFLDAAGHCKIHAVSPYGCSHFDWHMDKETGDERSMAALNAIVADREYRDHHHQLAAAGLISESPEAKRARLEPSRNLYNEDMQGT